MYIYIYICIYIYIYVYTRRSLKHSGAVCISISLEFRPHVLTSDFKLISHSEIGDRPLLVVLLSRKWTDESLLE